MITCNSSQQQNKTTLQNPRNRHEKLWKIFTNFVIKCKKKMLSQEQGASGPQDRDMMGETKKKGKKEK